MFQQDCIIFRWKEEEDGLQGLSTEINQLKLPFNPEYNVKYFFWNNCTEKWGVSLSTPMKALVQWYPPTLATFRSLPNRSNYSGCQRMATRQHEIWTVYCHLCKCTGQSTGTGWPEWKAGRVRLKPDGTRWRTGGEVRGKLANGVGSQYSHTTSERGVSSITNADAHTSAASSRLNWRPRRIKWTRPFRRKRKSVFCACAITFQTQST